MIEEWTVIVPHLDGGWKDHLNKQIRADIQQTAEELSRQYPNSRVMLSTMRVIRMTLLNGKVVQEIDDITRFYPDASETIQKDWKNITITYEKG